MDYLQYCKEASDNDDTASCFKPCYKWITFNTLIGVNTTDISLVPRFKPCYKWITFNTVVEIPLKFGISLLLF